MLLLLCSVLFTHTNETVLLLQYVNESCSFSCLSIAAVGVEAEVQQEKKRANPFSIVLAWMLTTAPERLTSSTSLLIVIIIVVVIHVAPAAWRMRAQHGGRALAKVAQVSFFHHHSVEHQGATLTPSRACMHARHAGHLCSNFTALNVCADIHNSHHGGVGNLATPVV